MGRKDRAEPAGMGRKGRKGEGGNVTRWKGRMREGKEEGEGGEEEGGEGRV